MESISSLNSMGNTNQLSQVSQLANLPGSRALEMASEEAKSTEEMQAVFQEFVAGTFYSSMLKAMHATHDKPAYMHGGQAEEMFQNQLDQQISKELAQEHGGDLVKSLVPAFSREANVKNPQANAPQMLNRI